MRLEVLQVSAFAAVPDGGNQAAVCFLREWPRGDVLSSFAVAIGQPVTSYLVQREGFFELRWFTRSGQELQSLCGHGTVAAAFALSLQHPGRTHFDFQTSSGALSVHRDEHLFFLELPRWDAVPMDAWPELGAALGRPPAALLDAGRDVLAVYSSVEAVEQLTPNMQALRGLGDRGFIATAASHSGRHDCVSRFFCPAFGLGVDEDPVTGSAHCSIAPWWGAQLGKVRIRAYQASKVGGELLCIVNADSVTIGAQAALTRRSTVETDDPCLGA